MSLLVLPRAPGFRTLFFRGIAIYCLWKLKISGEILNHLLTRKQITRFPDDIVESGSMDFYWSKLTYPHTLTHSLGWPSGRDMQWINNVMWWSTHLAYMIKLPCNIRICLNIINFFCAILIFVLHWSVIPVMVFQNSVSVRGKVSLIWCG